jgi:hypothetical protein
MHGHQGLIKLVTIRAYVTASEIMQSLSVEGHPTRPMTAALIPSLWHTAPETKVATAMFVSKHAAMGSTSAAVQLTGRK